MWLNRNESQKKVTLMTVHSSKGLEFDFIYIIGLEDGLFPLTRNYIDDDIEEENEEKVVEKETSEVKEEEKSTLPSQSQEIKTKDEK